MQSLEKSNHLAMRLFYAVMLPPEAVGALEERIRLWRTQIKVDGVAWSEPAQLHFTLRFLGETPLQRSRLAVETGRELAAKMISFEVSLGALGAFPSKERPSAVWIDSEEGGEHLSFMAERLESRMEGLGFRREPKIFHPHLTVARTKSYRAEAAMADWLKTIQESEAITFSVNHFSLMQAIPGPSGSTYRLVEQFAMASEPEK